MICTSYAEFSHFSKPASEVMGHGDSVCGRDICLISSETCECKACMLRSSPRVRSWGGREGALEGEQVGEKRHGSCGHTILIAEAIFTSQSTARQEPPYRLTWAQTLIMLPEFRSPRLPNCKKPLTLYFSLEMYTIE